MNNQILENPENYGLDFAEEVTTGITEKINTVFPSNESMQMKAYAANVLIGNVPAKKVSDCVGDVFNLCGFYVKDVLFRESNKKGTYTYMFGKKDNVPCAYCTSSEKVYDALKKIIIIYGEPKVWKQSIKIKIRMNTENDSKAYSLELV